jgi:hypothetical protein
MHAESLYRGSPGIKRPERVFGALTMPLLWRKNRQVNRDGHLRLFSSYMDARQLSSVTLPSYPRSPQSQPQQSKHSEHLPVTKQGKTCSPMMSDRRHTSPQNSVAQCGVISTEPCGLRQHNCAYHPASCAFQPSALARRCQQPHVTHAAGSWTLNRSGKGTWLLGLDRVRCEQRRSLIEARCSAGYTASLSVAGVV